MDFSHTFNVLFLSYFSAQTSSSELSIKTLASKIEGTAAAFQTLHDQE